MAHVDIVPERPCMLELADKPIHLPVARQVFAHHGPIVRHRDHELVVSIAFMLEDIIGVPYLADVLDPKHAIFLERVEPECRQDIREWHRGCMLRNPRVPLAHDSGSSPPVRGTPLAQLIQGRVGRFIPASAGNTQVEG